MLCRTRIILMPFRYTYSSVKLYWGKADKYMFLSSVLICSCQNQELVEVAQNVLLALWNILSKNEGEFSFASKHLCIPAAYLELSTTNTLCFTTFYSYFITSSACILMLSWNSCVLFPSLTTFIHSPVHVVPIVQVFIHLHSTPGAGHPPPNS